MFRKRKHSEEVLETKTESHVWEQSFRKVVVLGDGEHLAALVHFGNDCKIQIWNIQKQFLWEASINWCISAMLLLQDNELVIAEFPCTIHRIKINLETQQLEHLSDATFQVSQNIRSMTMMQDALAIGYENGVINFWDLTKKEKLHEVNDTSTIITRMSTLETGSLIYGDNLGRLYIADSKGRVAFRQFLDSSSITGLVVLPGNVVICGQLNGSLWDVSSFFSPEASSLQKFENILDLVCMPNGRIGCLTATSVQFVESSWVRNYIKNDLEIKNIINEHLSSSDLCNLVADYTGFGLFSPPRMPHNRKHVLPVEDHSMRSKKR